MEGSPPWIGVLPENPGSEKFFLTGTAAISAIAPGRVASIGNPRRESRGSRLKGLKGLGFGPSSHQIERKIHEIECTEIDELEVESLENQPREDPCEPFYFVVWTPAFPACNEC